MCNAWNHASDCKCGWGGDGHLGRRSSSSSDYALTQSGYYFFDVPSISHFYESYVNPNAACPVCGEAVFFYQSPHGSRVFFDELGPPWPKHPCTDTFSLPARLENHESYEKRAFGWTKEDWSPFSIDTVISFDKGCFKISGRCNDLPQNVYVRSDAWSENRLKKNHYLAHLKKISLSCFDLSIFCPERGGVLVKAYVFSSDVRDAAIKGGIKSKYKDANKAKKKKS